MQTDIRKEKTMEAALGLISVFFIFHLLLIIDCVRRLFERSTKFIKRVKSFATSILFRASQKDRTDYFTPLIDDCIYEIFAWLPLADLCSISETSKRLQALADDHFKRKHLENVPKMVNIYDSFTLPNQRHVQSFIHFSKAITVIGNTASKSEYLRRDFHNLKSIGFRYCHFDELFQKNMINIFKKVENIEIDVCTGSVDFLEHCDRLKFLKMTSKIRNKIHLYELPALESFEITVNKKRKNAEFINAFFNHHPNIKRFACHFNIMAAPEYDLTYFGMVFGSNLNCEELFYDFPSPFDFDLIRGQLEKLDQSDSLKRMAIMLKANFSEYNLNTLSTLRSMTELHFCGQYRGLENTFEHVKCVYITEAGLFEQFADNLLRNFPNMEELYLGDLLGSCYHCFSKIVRLLPKLRKILVLGHCMLRSETDFNQMNVERQELNGACKLVIYLDANTTCSHLMEAIKQNNSADSLVHIKIGRALMIESCNAVNPFFPFSFENVQN